MQSLRGELLRARALITELLAEPAPIEISKKLVVITKVLGMIGRLHHAAMEALARQIERLRP